MDNSPVKNPFMDITSEEVYEKARSQGSIERLFEDLKSCIKNSSSYISLMKATQQNILGDHFGTMPISDVQSKKKRLQEIAVLASQFDCSVSDIFIATTEVQGKSIIENIIKQLSFLKKGSASTIPSPNKKGQSSANVKSYDERQPGTSGNICEANEDSFDSVSSVHTSELSSWSDEIEVPTENRGSNGKKPKIISFKTVNKAYKSMVAEKKKTPYKRRRRSASKAQVSSGSNDSGETDTLPKRKRKPNSRYTSK